MSILESVIFMHSLFDLPVICIFLGAAIVLTIKIRFLQIRGLKILFAILSKKLSTKSEDVQTLGSINSFHALFTAMATTIGMGNMVGPTVAIYAGGPSALFWLVIYMFFASATKYTEVCFAIKTRVKTENGHLIGGPMEYLKLIHPFLAHWYVAIMMFLFIAWSALQTNTLAAIYAQESVPEWIVGLALAIVVFFILQGGAKRVGEITSKLVPFMFFLYVTFSMLILLKNPALITQALSLIFNDIFSLYAAKGGFFGATMLLAVRFGIYRSIYISEAGIGTSSIPHAMANTQNQTTQGILALYSMGADILISIMSGLLILVTGVWLTGDFRSTLIYEAFKLHAPGIGQLVLLVTITLFVLTTVIGNSFNGVQAYASLTNYRFTYAYIIATSIMTFFGAIIQTQLAWAVADLLLALVAIPNILGIVYLAFKMPEVIEV